MKRVVRGILRTLDTTIHEIGHTVVPLPFGSSLSIRIHHTGAGTAYTTTGIAQGTIFGPLVRIVGALAGYAFPVLFGAFLILAALTPTPNISAWWLVALAGWVVSGLLSTLHLRLFSLLAVIASAVFVFLGVVHVPFPVDVPAFTGVMFAGAVWTWVLLILLLSIRNVFGLVAVALWAAVGAAVFLPPWDAQWLVVALGALFITNGVVSIIRTFPLIGRGETDFDILAAETIFPAHFWFTLFIVATPLVVLFEIWVASGVGFDVGIWG